ncbi:hypothetical protein ACHAWF_004911 [Thalassiosira exigua]
MIEYCGLDIGGFYADWNYPLSKIQSYLKGQSPQFEEQWSRKIQPILEIMGNEKARYNHQHLLTLQQKATLGVLLDELMQLAGNYYINYENMLLSDSGVGVSKYSGLDGREIAMAHNIIWRLKLGDRGTEKRDTKRKMVVINHVIHTKTATQYQGKLWGHVTPMGQLLASNDHVDKLFGVGMLYGSGTFWNKWQTPQERFVDASPSSRDDGLEVVMKQISKEANLPNFFLHWERAPQEARAFLEAEASIRENEYYIHARPLEWNGCIYLDKVSPATPA